jgi:tRNA1(Val) A37 N6-methylase TrmN6
VLVEGVKGGRPGAAVEKPLRIYRGVNEYTDEVSAMIAGTRLRFGQSRTAEPPG